MASLFDELKRRNVFRVGIAYVVASWVLAQVAEFAFENFGAPDWVLKSFVVALVLGLPIALIVAWAFELTPEGIKREKDVDRSQSITTQTGRKLDFVIIGVLAIAVVLLLADRLWIPDRSPAEESLAEESPADEVTATAGRKSIAVLPFTNMSDDSDHFADGLSEELLNLLAKVPDLKVAGRTSAFQFKGRNEDLREIGAALGVEHVLEGSVRRSGERLRITAQLIKVEDGFHLWSETYDRQMADIFDIQDDVAGTIAEALRLQLAPRADRSTDNVEAYALYLQSLAMLSVAEPDELEEALGLLDRAIRLDPEFARAYELRAAYYWYLAAWILDAPTAQSQAYASAMKALELDPRLVAARSFAQTAKPDWNWIDEIGALEEAVRADPTSLTALGALTYDLVLTGYFEEAIRVSDRIIAQEPLSAVGYWRKGEALMAAGRPEEARATWRYAADRYDMSGVIVRLGLDALLEGRDDEAIGWIEKAWSLNGRDAFGAASFVASARDPDGGKAFLDAWVAKAVASAADFDERRSAYGWYLPFGYLDDYWAAIYALGGESGAGWTNADTLEQSGMVFRRGGFARHPEYLRRSRAQGVLDLWDKRGAPDHCTKASGDWVCE